MDTCSCPNCQFPADWPQFNDPQWERLAPLLPQGTGLRSDTTRRQVDGMLYALETGGAWRLLPTQFGPPDLVETRFRRWSAAGVLRRAYATLYPPRTLARGRTVIIDGSYAKVHISAAGARVGRSGQRCQFWCPGWCPGKRPWYCRETQAIGKTRGGFNTNIVIAVNDAGQLADWRLLPGNVPESRATPDLVESTLPRRLVADEAHDSNRIRSMLGTRSIEGAIRNHPRRKLRYPWHPALKLQHVADNYFARLKRFRRVATRYEKTYEGYDAMIALAALYIALRQDCPD